nr:hypothetical protein [Tanacetum cinerariifolium]
GLTTNEKGLISRMLRFDNVNSELQKKLAATQQLVNSFTAAAAQFDAKLQAVEEREAASRKVLAQEEAALRQRETDVANLERLLTEKSKSFP